MAPVKPTVQPSTENYPAQQHEHMKDLVNQNYDPNAATTVIDAWTQFGTKFKELANDFNKIVNDSQAGWNGTAAEGVRQALGKVGKFADDTGTAFHATAGAIAVQRDAAVQANRSMPEPVDYNPLKIAGKWASAAVIAPPAMIGGAYEMFSTYNEKQEAKQQAVQVMQTRDATMMSAAQSMPAMDATPQVTQDQGVTQPSSTTHSQSLNSVNSNQRFSSSNNTGMPPGSNSNGTTNASWVAPQANNPSLQNPGNNPNNLPGGQNRPPITPPGMLPPGMRPPGGGPGGAPGMRPGGAGGGRGTGLGGPGGGRGTGAGGLGGPGAAGRGAGSFGPSNPGGGAGVTGSGPNAAGAAGRAGAAGAGGTGAGGGAGAGKGGGEEDKEHKSNYLVPTDEFFDDDRMVAPPVIGG
ncbi:hypothetical protein ACWEIJ_10685 [Lentzea sp. NPDC004789]